MRRDQNREKGPQETSVAIQRKRLQSGRVAEKYHSKEI
jgi:hypothetical protein